MQTRPSARVTACLIAVLATFLVAGRRPPNVLPATGSQLFLGPKTNPIALSNDGTVVYALNSSAGTLSVRSAAAPYTRYADIAVGVEPVGLAVRPKVNPSDPLEDELVLVANHVSDSIAVVSRNALAVVDVIQTLDAEGVSTSDEPTGIAFAGPNRAFVTLDHRNELLELTMGGDGRFSAGARTLLAGQGPRALAVANGRLYVAVAESGNQTEFPSCGASQPVSFSRGNPVDEGCLFPMNQATLLQFATSPNVGGEVIRDTHIPDRDLFVFDLGNLATPIQVVTGVGTILNGVAVSGSRVFVTNTEARNDRDGLLALGNRMFENRLSFVDCAPTCGAVTRVDLEANAFDVPVPVPYGIAASADGATLVVTASNSDGVAGIPSDPGTAIPGLVTLSASGTVLGRVVTGALPEGVALRSDPAGAAETAFVLNSGDSTMTVVDVSDPASPALLATVPIGVDPAPPAVQRGRILFSAARASTSGTFSCESCHPQAHVDQLLWVINTLEGPADVPGCNPGSDDCPEPRSTMPIRGLRDTIPLHWVGTLADPIPGVFLAEDDGAPDCNLATDGEIGCMRHLVEGSLAGVMCAQPGCPTGPSGEPGALTNAERDDLAAFLAAVSYPPSPARRPTDALSTTARTGVGDFFLDRGGAFNNPRTCADINGGCHALPLGVATNSPLVGRFDAPTMRGLQDRFLLFSDGIFGSEEFLASAGFSVATTGFTEFRSLAATFPGLFTLAYNVTVDNIWAFVNEQSIGLPGIAGRQLVLSPENAGVALVEARAAQIEGFATEGRITAVARIGVKQWRWKNGLWTPPAGPGITRSALRAVGVADGLRVIITAELPAKLQAGGTARQPLLWVADNAQGPNVPRIRAGTNGSFTAFAAYIDAAPKVLVNGTLCAACTATWNAGAGTVSVSLAPAPAPAGTYVVQILNPEGFASNELPLVTTN
jgi:DNA-binding beta-propeller fold protein YncE